MGGSLKLLMFLWGLGVYIYGRQCGECTALHRLRGAAGGGQPRTVCATAGLWLWVGWAAASGARHRPSKRACRWGWAGARANQDRGGGQLWLLHACGKSASAIALTCPPALAPPHAPHPGCSRSRSRSPASTGWPWTATPGTTAARGAWAGTWTTSPRWVRARMGGWVGGRVMPPPGLAQGRRMAASWLAAAVQGCSP